MISVTCDLKLSSQYLVVLHPAGELREEELVKAGVAPTLLDEFRALRISDNPAIYVVATDPAVTGVGANRSIRSTRTTYQQRFVEIDRPLVVVKRALQPVRVELSGTIERRVVSGIH